MLQYSHRTTTGNACNEIQNVSRNEMDEDGGDLEHDEARQELQVRIPDSWLEWVHVQQFVGLLNNMLPLEWVVRRRGAVEDWKLVRSLLCNVVTGDENLVHDHVDGNVIVDEGSADGQATNDALGSSHQEALRTVLADCPSWVNEIVVAAFLI